MNISALLKFLEGNSISKDNFVDGFKTVQQEGNYLSDSIFAESYTTSELENIFETFDVNSDGQIDQNDKLKGSMFSEENMSEKDLELLVKEFNDMLAEGLLGSVDSLTKTFSTQRKHRSSNGSNGNNGGDSPDVTKSEDYSKMSAAELTSKLSDAQGTLASNQELLNKIIDGSDATLAAMKENVTTAEEQYQNMLEQVAPELAEKYKTAKDDLDQHNQAIADKKVSINETQSEIDSLTSSIANLDSNIAAYNSAISELEAARGQENAPDDLEAKISEARSKRDAAQTKRDAEQQKLNAANEKLNTLNGELSDLESQTSEKEQAVQTIEAEINKLNNSELTNLKQAVIDAQNEYDSKQSEMKTAAQSAIETSQAEVNKIQSALNDRQAKDIQKDYSVLDIKNAEKIYETLGLEALGLNKDVFMLAMEGYNNLEDKGNGFLGIFDTID